VRKIDYEALVRDPELQLEIERAARRERAAVVRDLFARLFKAPVKKEMRGAAGPRLAH
jgi:hypothetical protein